MKAIKQKLLVGALLVCMALPALAGLVPAYLVWMTRSSACVALIVPHAQLLCVMGVGSYPDRARLVIAPAPTP